jgi:mercuric reductase
VNGKRLTGQALLIATGARPVLPDMRGLSEVPFLTSDLLTMGEHDELAELPRSLLIVGGGYVALKLGQMFRRFGTAVTILEQSRELCTRGYEPEVGPAVREVFVEEGIDVLTLSTVATVRADRGGVLAMIVVDGTLRELRAERLLIATGRQPNTDRIGLENTGVTIGAHGQVVVDEYLRTRVPHIFAAGDVIGGEQGSQMATPVGSQDGGIVAHNALSGELPRKVNHRLVPRAVFIDPPLAVVGMTEREAIAAGRECWCGSVPMSLVPRAAAMRETRGFVKMVADARTHEVLGVTMLGHGGAEVIHEAAMGLRFRATLRDFIDLLHVYPTMAEALKIVAVARFKDPAKLSCCASSCAPCSPTDATTCSATAFSFADITMAASLQFILPVAERFISLGPATREAWTHHGLAAEYPDLLAWRDRPTPGGVRRGARAARSSADPLSEYLVIDLSVVGFYK